jgi:hypothetical protein
MTKAFTKIKFALRHPITTVKYFITKDIEHLREIRRLDKVLYAFNTLFGVKPYDEVKKYLNELREEEVYDYVKKLSSLWPKVDSSGMIPYKGPLIYCLIKVS